MPRLAVVRRLGQVRADALRGGSSGGTRGRDLLSLAVRAAAGLGAHRAWADGLRLWRRCRLRAAGLGVIRHSQSLGLYEEVDDPRPLPPRPGGWKPAGTAK